MAINVLQDIVAVRHVGGRRLWLRFEDGIQGEIDLADVIPNPRGLLVQLMDPAFVAKVRVDPELGTVTWPGHLDLDSVVLYCAVRGIPIPTEEPVARPVRAVARRTRRTATPRRGARVAGTSRAEHRTAKRSRRVRRAG